MNIDSFRSIVGAGLARLEELVVTINDIIENRVEKNLKVCRRPTAHVTGCALPHVLPFLRACLRDTAAAASRLCVLPRLADSVCC
jgi:hypothetical protein